MNRNMLAALALVSLIATPLAAAPMTFDGILSGPNEEPPNGSLGTGLATVTIDPATHMMTVDVVFSGLGSNNTAAHIHIINGPGDANTSDTLGPVATTMPTFIGFPNGTFGDFHAVYDMTLAANYRSGFITDSGGTTALAETALFNGIIQGRAYLNVHSISFPGGEIRSFLAPVPEPSTALLLGLGALAVPALRRRFRRAR